MKTKRKKQTSNDDDAASIIISTSSTDIGYEMSGTVVISQSINGEINEVFLTKEDISKIVEIAIYNDVAPKSDFE